MTTTMPRKTCWRRCRRNRATVQWRRPVLLRPPNAPDGVAPTAPRIALIAIRVSKTEDWNSYRLKSSPSGPKLSRTRTLIDTNINQRRVIPITNISGCILISIVRRRVYFRGPGRRQSEQHQHHPSPKRKHIRIFIIGRFGWNIYELICIMPGKPRIGICGVSNVCCSFLVRMRYNVRCGMTIWHGRHNTITRRDTCNCYRPGIGRDG